MHVRRSASVWLCLSSTDLLDELGLLWHRRRRSLAEREVELVANPCDTHDTALGEASEQQFLGERLLDVLLDDAAERPRAEQRIVAALGEPFARLGTELDGDVAVGELLLELEDELVDDAPNGFRRQRLERDDGIEPIAELRREHAVDRLMIVADTHRAAE